MMLPPDTILVSPLGVMHLFFLLPLIYYFVSLASCSSLALSSADVSSGV